MQKRYYLLAGEIQSHMLEYQEKYHKKITFSEAVNALYGMGEGYNIMPPMPEYEFWKIGDISEFRKLYMKYPIEVTYFLQHPDEYGKFMSEKTEVFTENDVDVVVLMCAEQTKIHVHDYFEIAYVMDGEATLLFENESRVLGTGNCCIIAPFTKHDVQPIGNAVVVDFMVRKSTFDSAFHNILKNDDVLSTFFNNCLYSSAKNYLLFSAELTEKIQEIIKNIMIESVSYRPYANEVCNCYLSVLMAEIMRIHKEVFSYYTPGKTTNIPMTMILTYIKNNYQHVTLAAVAEFFNYDSAYLGKQIKLCTNMYYNDIVNNYKINQAVNLLKYTEDSLTSIADTVGYNNYDHFCRTFKKLMKMTPGQYKKQLHK